MDRNYSYPTNESETDAAETDVDPWKLERESAIIRSMIGYDWATCLDYGTGIGRYLPLLDRAATIGKKNSEKNKRIIAYDIDHRRIEQARTRELNCETQFLSDSMKVLRRNIPRNSIDLILCCQVLGHVSQHSLQEIMEFSYEKLSFGGTMVVCIPFHCLGDIDDFFHIVDLNRALLGQVDFRKKLSQEEFSQEVDHPRDGILPVRAYSVDGLDRLVCNAVLPFPVAPPRSLISVSKLTPLLSFVYSVHLWSEEGAPQIGDVVLKMIKE